MDELNQLFQEYNEVLEMQQFEEAGLDYSLVEMHIDFLTRLDVIENSAISIFDLYRKEHVFVSNNYSKMFKYDLTELEMKGNDFFNSKHEYILMLLKLNLAESFFHSFKSFFQHTSRTADIYSQPPIPAGTETGTVV